MTRYPIVRLASLAHSAKGSMAGGPFGSDLVSRDYVTSGVPVIRGTNLPKHSKFSLDNCVFVTESKADALHLNCAHPGDLVFTQRGTLGQVGLIPNGTPYSRFLISQSQMKMVVDRSRADPLYIYHYFRLPSTVAHIENHALQAGVPHINLGILRRFEIICPPLAAQKKIAAILSAYDDLIANNQRRITLLERMAEDIYREWFVRLRFPGHQGGKLEQGLPQGWRAAAIGEVFKTASGGTPSRTEAANFGGEIPWIKTGELKTTFAIGSEETVTQQGIENSAAKVYKKYTVIMAMYCAMPDLSIIANDAATNQACCAFSPRNAKFHHSYCYFLIKFAQLQLVMFAHGAAQQNLSQEIIKKFPVLLPSEDLVVAFGMKVGPIFDSMEALMRANLQLKATRDALLPRLISGKLAVDALDICFPPGMSPSA